MPRTGSITMSLPPFAGATRRLILANLAAFFGVAILGWVSSPAQALFTGHMVLEPLAVIHGELWQLLTYSFIQVGILSTVFAMLTLWFTGSLLEGSYGSRWLYELYFTSVIGGAIVATIVALTPIFRMNPRVAAIGPYGGIFGLLVAIALLFGEQEFLLWFVLRIKAKYLVTIYILIAVAVLLKSADAFSALLQLSGALCGYLYVKFAPRRGFAFGFTERYFGMRNGYYRWKRRRAARKFEVYMRKQNRVVHFDKDGRYIDPDEARKDPNDRRWMN
ncbi:rhomboid family intramembrane serine protease [Granulicella sp. dw_53]|uniref:rhomboid family intramembrane serine protease n=1 Tax=Granulicella sp. dw_53 TaxID=2719792 RepID=UPI001BD66F8F|nr:rhomboid family intramembrane serine protease [Granulicella sp. dw_53]